MLFVLILAAPALGQKKIEAGKVGAADVRMHIFPVSEGSGKSREERSKDPMTFVDLSQIPVIELVAGVKARTPYGQNLMFSYVEMEEGAEVPTHSHVHEQGGMLLAGQIRMTIASETRVLEKGALYLIPPNTPHRVLATKGPVKILDVFTPVRSDYVDLMNKSSKKEKP
jgi:quercetin dioxygenase-like cupin family protein